MVQCEGEATVLDYKPRHYSFSFGYHCQELVRPSLRGLSFNFTITGQSNKTTCTKIPSGDDGFFNYHQLYTSTSLPNMIGISNKDIRNNFMVKNAISLIAGFALSTNGRLCHKYAREILCHILYPRCESIQERVIHLCKEACDDFLAACWEQFKSSIRKLDFPGTLFRRGLRRRVHSSKLYEINCDYLPSINGSIPCFYKFVTCESPPNVTNAGIMNRNQH